MSMNAKEIVVDLFAGGGGASLGIAWATGRAPDVAINHDALAIAMHTANHPDTKHFCEDIRQIPPRRATKGRKIGALWASPDCRDFSRAKGGEPVSRHVRGLAWMVVKWAAQEQPRLIMLENVREFEQWGPLVPQWLCKACGWKGSEGQAVLHRHRRRCPRCESLRISETEYRMRNPDKLGLTFKIWVGRLRGLGYQVQWRSLDAADYGAPTHRKRLFMIARRDGLPIVWPEPTHAAPAKIDAMPLFGRLRPHRTAAECIDWSLPCPSIFDRKRPLADKTLRRIAMGLKRYVLDAPRPFIVPVTHAGERRAHDIAEPLPTITRAHRGEFAMVAPTMIQAAYGDNGRWGDGTCNIQKPMGVIHAGGNNHALVAAALSPFIAGVGGRAGQSPATTGNAPIGTVTGKADKALIAANLIKFRGESNGHPLDQPMPTITSGAGSARPAGAAHAMGIAAAYLARFNHGDKQWNGVDAPLGTVTSQGNKFGLVFAFLTKYFGTAIGQPLFEPLHTITGKHRFGLVAVELSTGVFDPAIAVDLGELGTWVIADIGLRMLVPRELARAQGFPDTYLLTGFGGRKISTSEQVAKIGNSVCPPIAKAIVEANFCRDTAGVAR